jgi:hypothetical protein
METTAFLILVSFTSWDDCWDTYHMLQDLPGTTVQMECTKTDPAILPVMPLDPASPGSIQKTRPKPRPWTANAPTESLRPKARTDK